MSAVGILGRNVRSAIEADNEAAAAVGPRLQSYPLDLHTRG